jgi:hypothetical protein
VRSTPWQASPLGRPRIGWGAEGLIIEQGAAEAVGLLRILGQERCDYLVRLVDQLSPILGIVHGAAAAADPGFL